MPSPPLLSLVEPKSDDQPIHEWVYATLCESLLSGQFVPGLSITLRGIAKQLDISPMPVREALRRLVAEGALEVLSNRRIAVPLMTATRLRELQHARLAIEPELAASALEYIDVAKIHELEAIDAELNRSLESGNVDAYINANRQFHFGIYGCAESPVWLPMVKGLWMQFAPFTRIVFGRVGTDYLQDYHADAISALKAGRADQFRQAIHDDISDGMKMLKQRL